MTIFNFMYLRVYDGSYFLQFTISVKPFVKPLPIFSTSTRVEYWILKEKIEICGISLKAYTHFLRYISIDYFRISDQKGHMYSFKHTEKRLIFFP